MLIYFIVEKINTENDFLFTHYEIINDQNDTNDQRLPNKLMSKTKSISFHFPIFDLNKTTDISMAAILQNRFC